MARDDNSREAKLVQALRANLRRRKAAPADKPSDDPDQALSGRPLPDGMRRLDSEP